MAEDEREPHDRALDEAVQAWCDAELIATGAARGTFLGEWHLITTRQGYSEDGEPVAQTFVRHSPDHFSRILGVLEEARLRMDVRVRAFYADGDFS